MITTPTRTTEPQPLPAAAAPAARSDTRSWLAERISSETAVLMAATWYVLFTIGATLEPDAAGTTPAWSVALSAVFLGLLAVTAAGFLARRRWGVLASLAAGALFTASAVACPVSGHHGLAPWWFAQMACALGLVVASAVALRRPAA